MPKQSTIPEESIAQYKLIVSKIPEMEQKGKSLPYTSMNGNMYSMMRKDGALGIRLSAEDRKTFMEKYQAVPFENYGSPIKEYVEVPAHLLMDTDTMVEYMKKSHAYAKTLKPKPTTKAKKKPAAKESKKVTHLVGKTYKNGQVQSTLQDDLLTFYFVDGAIKAQGKIINEKMNGKWIFNKKGGSLMQIGHFKEDVKNGEWIRYDSKGEIAYHVEFSNGKIVKKFV